MLSCPAMRLAVISDIHGNIRALEAVLARIRALGDIDRLVVAGDLLSGPLEPSGHRRRADVARGRRHPRQPRAPAPRLRRGARRGERPVRLRAHHRRRSGRGSATLPATLELAPDVLVCHGTPETDLRLPLRGARRRAGEAGRGRGHHRASGRRAPGPRALRPLAPPAHRAPLHRAAGGQRRERRPPGLPRASRPTPTTSRTARRTPASSSASGRRAAGRPSTTRSPTTGTRPPRPRHDTAGPSGRAWLRSGRV